MEDAEIQYRLAVERERFLRDAAFLPVTESIGPFEVVPMTLRHYLSLRLIRSPFITGETATPDDAANLLWQLSPRYSPSKPELKAGIVKRCQAYAFASPPVLHLPWLMRRWEDRCQRNWNRFQELLAEIQLYVRESIQDRPPQTMERGQSYYSEAVGVIDTIAEEYGWEPDMILDMPIKVTFQIMKLIRTKRAAKAGEQKPMFNPSDILKPLLSNEALNRN